MESRREFIKTSGYLIVSGSALLSGGALAAEDLGSLVGVGAQGVGPYPDPDFRQLDSWIVIRSDNTATFFVGKTDLGQGTGTAFRQIMADELDIAFENTSCVMGSTDVTVDQGGSGGSDALQTDGYPMRRVAAEARRVLLEMASQHFGVPVSELHVSDGVVSVLSPGSRLPASDSRQITYGELIGGKKFNVTLTGKNTDTATGIAKLKPVQEMKNVGKSPRRYDIPPKINGTAKWAVDVKVPGMVHGRNVRPPFAGAALISVDESSVKNIPGFIKVVTKGNYVAVVCEREENAIRAARQLKVQWKKPDTPPFPASDDLFKYMRAATPSSTGKPVIIGNPDGGFASAATVIEAEYEVPFQGHNSIGPAHALADPSSDQLTIYSNDMKSYGMRNSVAQFLNIPRDRVRVVWMEGPQAYGRTAADDAGFEAAYLAKEIGRPVRVQWSRQEETAWDTKGPAYAVKLRGGLDAHGNLVALHYDACAADYNHLGYNEQDSVLISQLMGTRRKNISAGRASLPSDMYVIPNRLQTTRVVPLPMPFETPLRTGNLRDPDGPQVTFASESFIDELAAAAKADPVEFRLKLIQASTQDDGGFKRARSVACIKAAAEKFGWDARPSPNPRRGNGDVLTGRGIAYAYRSQTVIAEIAEVEVNRKTGRIWVKRLVIAHDCGLVINPEALTRTLENGALHSVSRALYEEVKFDTEKVTTVDWLTSPTLRHDDVPERIDVVLVNGDPNPNRPDLPHYGAGETVCKPTLAAIANAVFDATGVRLRRIPLRNATDMRLSGTARG
ncbi:MAG TPA: molybdopterin cofactor-binding domain-containing protein [Vicinamibacterales bacterium]|nr:molybdopterin cofactor-binding domain-containing protein [Vicinamibacterales bacterium]